MGIENKPSVYNTPSIYKLRGSGGGGSDTYDYYDIGGLVYKCKEINGIIWMCENLKRITANNNINPGRWDNGNNNVFISEEGVLYNGSAIDNLNGDLAGSGWRIATISDWTNLFEFAGGPLNYMGQNFGAKKVCSKSGWPLSYCGDNDLLFDIKRTGYIYSNSFSRPTGSCRFWAGDISGNYQRVVWVEPSNGFALQIPSSDENRNTCGFAIRLCRDA